MPELTHTEGIDESLTSVERWWAALSDEQRAEIPDTQRAAIEETVARMQEDRGSREYLVGLARRRHWWTTVTAVPTAVVCLGAALCHLVAPQWVGADSAGLCVGIASVAVLIWVSNRTLLRLELAPETERPVRSRAFAERVEYYQAVVRGLKAVGSLRTADAGSVALFHARAHLDALAQSPDGAALPLVDFLANNMPDPDLQLAAQDLLPAIRDLADRQKAGQVLLRPAEPGADALLRVPEDDGQALLRAVGEGEQDG